MSPILHKIIMYEAACPPSLLQLRIDECYNSELSAIFLLVMSSLPILFEYDKGRLNQPTNPPLRLNCLLLSCPLERVLDL